MKFHSRSIVVLSLMVGLVLFLGGFRLGRLIEKADKSYVPPAHSPMPTEEPARSPTAVLLRLATFTHPCGFSFDYPASLSIQKQSSTSAELSDAGKNSKPSQFIKLTCTNTTTTASASTGLAGLIGLTPPADITPTTEHVGTQIVQIYSVHNTSQWALKNPKLRMRINFTVSSNLNDLVIRTLRLTP